MQQCIEMLVSEYVTKMKIPCLIGFIVSDSEGKWLKKVAGGQLGGEIIMWTPVRCIGVRKWNLLWKNEVAYELFLGKLWLGNAEF